MARPSTLDPGSWPPHLHGVATRIDGLLRWDQAADKALVEPLVVHQVPHVEDALHRVGFAGAGRALDQHEGYCVVPSCRRAQMACCHLQWKDRPLSVSVI